MPPRLTQFRLCPRSRSVRLALAEYGHDVTLLDENPLQWRKGFLAKNPAGEMPVLEYDNGLTLCGAYSISEFIAEEARPGSTVMSGGVESGTGKAADVTGVEGNAALAAVFFAASGLANGGEKGVAHPP